MLPTFIIIGAMKSGTTSLYHYLSKHPEICMAGRINTPELDFFVHEKNYRKGLKWYESKFTDQAKAYGETSPNYSKYPAFKGVPQRMYAVVSQVKLIYLLRDPIDRIVSHYVHNYADGREKRIFSEALAKLDDNNNYVACSKYYMQLEQYLQYYPRENILIITSDELKNQRRATLKTVFRFLGVDESFYSPEYETMLHKSSDKQRKNRLGRFFSELTIAHKIKPYLPSRVFQIYRKMAGTPFKQPMLNKSLEEKLIEHLKDDVNSLRTCTGKAFAIWCV